MVKEETDADYWQAELGTVALAANKQMMRWAREGHPVERTLLIAMACVQIARNVLKTRDGAEGESLGDALVDFGLNKTVAAAVPSELAGTITLGTAKDKGAKQ